MLAPSIQRLLPILLRNFSKLVYRALVIEPEKRWPALYPLTYLAMQVSLLSSASSSRPACVQAR